MAHNKLKDLELTSVDLVKRGANPDADIMLYKSMDGAPEEPVKKSFWTRFGEGIAKAFSHMDDEDFYDEDEIFKSDEAERIEKAEDTMYHYTGALEESFSSIMKDNTLSGEERQALLLKSLGEFSDTVADDIIKSFGGNSKKANKVTPKSNESEEIDEMRIDKSRLSTAEAATLDALLAKAAPKVDPSKGNYEVEIEEDDDDMDKNMHPAVKKALERMETLTKSMEMKEFESIAKKYEALGEDVPTLANTLYDLKKSAPSHYDSYIQILDKSLAAVQGSGLFAEIGKSYVGGPVAKSAPEAKIESIAKGFMEKDPTMDYPTALMKAWEANPALAADYDKQY